MGNLKMGKLQTNEGNLGPYKYISVYIHGMGHRIDWINPPPQGTKIVHKWNGEVETVDEIGVAGMIYHTNAEGLQSASFPSDLRIYLKCAEKEDSDGTGYCRGCGTTIGEPHHGDCDRNAE